MPWRKCQIFLAHYRNRFPKEVLFLVEMFIVTCLDTPKYVRNEGSPSPCFHGLNAIPKHILDLFTHVGGTKHTLFGDGHLHNMCRPFIGRNRFVPNTPHEHCLFARMIWVPNMGTMKHIVSQEMTLALVHHSRHAMDSVDNRVFSKLSNVLKEIGNLQPTANSLDPN